MQKQVKECLPLAPAALHILLALAAEVNRLEGVVHEARFRLQALKAGGREAMAGRLLPECTDCRRWSHD